MHETVENRVGERRVADDVVPLVYGKLAGHDRRADAVAVLEQVVAVLRGEGGQPAATGCSFTTAAAMLTTLTKALSEGRFDDKLKVFTIPRLLIID